MGKQKDSIDILKVAKGIKFSENHTQKDQKPKAIS